MVKPDQQLRVYESIVDLIASPENPTPMVKISEKINPNKDFLIYLKLERYNPFGSVKDRIALSMLKGLEIKEGQSLVEPSSGNTGIALAAVANAKGLPIEIAVPERIPEEKKTILRLLGVNALWQADDKLCPLYPNEGARGLVNAILKSKGGEKYVNPNQYENKLNVQAHYETTGPEIWKQTKEKIDYFFAGFGTCGTITGVGRYLKERKPSVKIIGIEPAKADHNLPGMKRISDLQEDLVPKILDKSVIDDTIAVDDQDAYQTAIQLAREDGILVGPTTGAILYVSFQYAKKCKGLAVAISPDDAFKYMSFYEPYVKEQGRP
ncbi:MAG: PLP-dependent cysteine synthase family protein [Sedimentisphaerales bacterium]